MKKEKTKAAANGDANAGQKGKLCKIVVLLHQQ